MAGAFFKKRENVKKINEEEVYLFHIEMWIYVHGIITMLATSYGGYAQFGKNL